jgi:hypothetical protein
VASFPERESQVDGASSQEQVSSFCPASLPAMVRWESFQQTWMEPSSPTTSRFSKSVLQDWIPPFSAGGYGHLISWNCASAPVEGTTNRVRLQEERFLAIEIPLPPLEEQGRIVTRIDGLVAKIAEARFLRRQATEDATSLLRSQMGQTFDRLSQLHGQQTFGSFSPHVNARSFSTTQDLCRLGNQPTIEKNLLTKQQRGHPYCELDVVSRR